MHELSTTESRRFGLVTKTVGDVDSVNASDVKESEFSWDGGYLTAFTNTMAKLVYNAKPERDSVVKNTPFHLYSRSHQYTIW